jgi:hypothetical protein
MDLEKKLKAIKDGSNNTMYDHLAALVQKILKEHPNRPFKNFEELSQLLKLENSKKIAPHPGDEGKMIETEWKDLEGFLSLMAEHLVSVVSSLRGLSSSRTRERRIKRRPNCPPSGTFRTSPTRTSCSGRPGMDSERRRAT